MNAVLKVRQKFDKYRIEKRLSEGGFGVVYQAKDTIEGIRVALKIPHQSLVDQGMLDEFRHEVRLAAQLDHPHILPLKNAAFIEGRFVIVFALGEETLADRLARRLSTLNALEFSEQMLEAVAYAHENNIIHCDLKPENFILFPGNQLRLTDFGIAKVAQRTIRASGSGTVGCMAPEQAMGQPSFRSDVFSLGLILYRMFSGQLPEWPFEWPFPGATRLRRKVPTDYVEFLRKALQVPPKKRYRDAIAMQTAFRRVKPKVLRYVTADSRVTRRTGRRNGTDSGRNWQQIRWQHFQRDFGSQLATNSRCTNCEGPVSEPMSYCPWCCKQRKTHQGDTRMPAHCPRCKRGMKLDWHYCPWCYGPGFEVTTSRQFPDRRYQARCTNASCSRKLLMPFMRYCPWCNRKVRRKWRIEGVRDLCGGCGWGVVKAYWSHCAWCSRTLVNT